jgi:3-oxoacyl-[acyl-carrier-protein] synthase II
VARSVSVSGIGIVSAFGTSHAAFGDAVREGFTGIRPVRGFLTNGCRDAGREIAEFESSAWVPAMRRCAVQRRDACAYVTRTV